jgi:hypothetical protein
MSISQIRIMQRYSELEDALGETPSWRQMANKCADVAGSNRSRGQRVLGCGGVGTSPLSGLRGNGNVRG